MRELSRPQLLGYVAIGVVVVVLGAWWVRDGQRGAATSGPVNLNSATVEELDELDGIGPVTAQKIVDHREAHGGFASVDDLDAVPGIGPATIEALRDQVTV